MSATKTRKIFAASGFMTAEEALQAIIAMIDADDSPVDDCGKAIVPMTAAEADTLLDDIYAVAENTLNNITIF